MTDLAEFEFTRAVAELRRAETGEPVLLHVDAKSDLGYRIKFGKWPNEFGHGEEE